MLDGVYRSLTLKADIDALTKLYNRIYAHTAGKSNYTLIDEKLDDDHITFTEIAVLFIALKFLSINRKNYKKHLLNTDIIYEGYEEGAAKYDAKKKREAAAMEAMQNKRIMQNTMNA